MIERGESACLLKTKQPRLLSQAGLMEIDRYWRGLAFLFPVADVVARIRLVIGTAGIEVIALITPSAGALVAIFYLPWVAWNLVRELSPVPRERLRCWLGNQRFESLFSCGEMSVGPLIHHQRSLQSVEISADSRFASDVHIAAQSVNCGGREQRDDHDNEHDLQKGKTSLRAGQTFHILLSGNCIIEVLPVVLELNFHSAHRHRAGCFI